ncbi:MAG: radical SAM protein [Deltaproteobacteria bacterium]|nr:radical SAM protein [Deltaproteobacteria bacterium]
MTPPGAAAQARAGGRPTGCRDISLEVTQRCNSRCLSCNTWRYQRGGLAGQPTDRGPELDLAEHLAVIRDARTMGVASVELHGGEPSLCKHLPQLVRACSDAGLTTHFATNGLHYTRALVRALIGAHLGGLRFSLDGVGKDHDRLRGVAGAYDRLVRTMGMFVAADTDRAVGKSIRTNVSSANLARIDRVLDVAREIGIDTVTIAFHACVSDEVVRETNELFGEAIASLRSAVPATLLPTDVRVIARQQQALQEKARRLQIALTNTQFLLQPPEMVPRGIKRPHRGPCRDVYGKCVIDAFGDVYPCETLRFRLGNVREMPLERILAGDRYRQFIGTYEAHRAKLRICDYCCESL